MPTAAHLLQEQKAICEKYGAPWQETPGDLKVGIALNVRSGLLPINGLRRPPDGGLSGWYLWAGEEFSEASDFFVPLHASHLAEWCPAVLKYLGLGPGWRFLIAGDYEDLWDDSSLLLPEE